MRINTEKTRVDSIFMYSEAFERANATSGDIASELLTSNVRVVEQIEIKRSEQLRLEAAPWSFLFR